MVLNSLATGSDHLLFPGDLGLHPGLCCGGLSGLGIERDGSRTHAWRIAPRSRRILTLTLASCRLTT